MKIKSKTFFHEFPFKLTNERFIFRLLKIKALHSELLTELSSRVSSRNESGRVRKKLKKLVPTLIFKKRQFPTRSDPNFTKKPIFFAKIRVGMGRNESERVFESRDEFRKSSKNSFRP